MISSAPRLADTNASPVIHGDNDRPDRKKSTLVRIVRRAAKPTPNTVRK
jgi:hypothetical protein